MWLDSQDPNGMCSKQGTVDSVSGGNPRLSAELKLVANEARQVTKQISNMYRIL